MRSSILAFLAWAFLLGSLFNEAIGPRVYDTLVSSFSAELNPDDVVLLVKESQDEIWLNRRVWPRSVFAKALRRLDRLGVRAMGLDFLLRGSDASSTGDSELVRALAESRRSVLATCFGHEGQRGEIVSLEEPALPFLRSAAALGAINLHTTGRSMVRQVPLALKIDGRAAPRGASSGEDELVPAFALSVVFVASGAVDVDSFFGEAASTSTWLDSWNRLFDELDRRGLPGGKEHPADALEAAGIEPFLREALTGTPPLRAPVPSRLPSWLASIPAVEALRRREQARRLVGAIVSRLRPQGRSFRSWWLRLADASFLVDRLVALQGSLPPDPRGTPGGIDGFTRLRIAFGGGPGKTLPRMGFRSLCRDRDYLQDVLSPRCGIGFLLEGGASRPRRILCRPAPEGALSLRVLSRGGERPFVVLVHLESGRWGILDGEGQGTISGLPAGTIGWYGWSHGAEGSHRSRGRFEFDGSNRPVELDLLEAEPVVAPSGARGGGRVHVKAFGETGWPIAGDPLRCLRVVDLRSGKVATSRKAGGSDRDEAAGKIDLDEVVGAEGALVLAETREGRRGVLGPWRHRLCGAAVLFGSALRYEQDFYPVPSGAWTGQEMAGVEIQGQAVANLLSDGGIRAPDERFVLPLTLGLFVGLSLASLFVPFGALVLIWTMGVMFPLLLSAYLMANERIWFDPEGAATLMLCGFVALVVQRVFVEQREARRRKAIFGKFVTPQVVDQILAQDAVVLNGERREVTVLFSDIRSFTTISEELEPGDVSRMLNEYFDRMTPVLLRHEGTFDKFIGDAVMGFFGAPILQEAHPIMAVRAAWEMLHENRKLQREWEERDDVSWPTFRIGFGLATGVCQVGLIGSRDVANYTVLGDTVNLAARLESLNSKMGTELLISAATYARVRDFVVARKVEKVDVKGKKEPVDVYQVLELRDDADGTNGKGRQS